MKILLYIIVYAAMLVIFMWGFNKFLHHDPTNYSMGFFFKGFVVIVVEMFLFALITKWSFEKD